MGDGGKADISIFPRGNQYFDCSGGRWQSDAQAEGMQMGSNRLKNAVVVKGSTAVAAMLLMKPTQQKQQSACGVDVFVVVALLWTVPLT